MWNYLAPIVLLVGSNVFMTFAWYGHLKYLHERRLWMVILISWGVALFEYCFQVPANRIGVGVMDGYQLKIIQEVITLVVFVIFAKVVLGQAMRWNHLVAFGLLAAAAFFAFYFKGPATPVT